GYFNGSRSRCRKIAVLNCLTQPVGHFETFNNIRLNQKHRKLIAADTRYKIRRTNPVVQCFGQVVDHCITSFVSKRIVNFLELVNIEQQEAERMAIPFSAFDFSLQLLVEAPSISRSR